MSFNTIFGILNGIATVAGGVLSQTVSMNDGTKTSLYLALAGTLVNTIAHLWSPATPGQLAAPPKA